MATLQKRWPAALVGTGILLILVFVIREISETQSTPPSGEQQARITTAALLPQPSATTTPRPSQTPAGTMTSPATARPSSTPTFTPTATASAAPTASDTPAPTVKPRPTRTAVPLLPTEYSVTPTVEEELPPAVTETAEPITTTAATAACSADFCIPRFGANGRIEVISAAYDAGLPFGAYFNWELEIQPIPVGTATFWQMLRVSEFGIRTDMNEVALAIEANPGSIWIIGNEPDIVWQDNTTAETYAELYHTAYHYIKERDPSALIAVAGVGQPTPLRLAYLDTVLESYLLNYGEPMPVDIWTIHNFILREERDSWGVGIPPGIVQESGEPVNEGLLYEIEDHDDLEIFRQNLVDFRQWMAERGYRDRPLALTEFGILMPADFGFPPPVVARFLQETFEYLVTAADETIGYPADENRLVQWSFWYSVYDPLEFPTGNLYNPETNELTGLGQIYVEYINGNND